MEKNYTEQQLIKFLYGECDVLERLEVEYALETDDSINAMFTDLQNSYRELPKVKFRPSSTSISRIINYSNSSPLIAA